MTTPLLIVAIVSALIWTAMTATIFHHVLKTQYLRPISGPISADSPRVEVVIPALNEEERVETTVRNVLAQEYPHLHLTVVNDRSTDQTGAILDRLAETLPVRVIHGVPRPTGWVGKTWAISQGASGATAEWLLFVDADMELHPRALATALDQASKADADLVSIIARPEIKTFWQGAIAVTIGELLFTMYPTHLANDPKSPVAIAAGGFLLVKRSVYERVGGHEAVRAEIVEDIQFGRLVKQSGGRLSIHLAPDLAWTHMYGTFGDLWRGLRKNAYAGMEYQLRKYIAGAIGGQIMAWTPMVATVVGLAIGSWPLAIVGAWGWLAQALSVAPSIPYLRISPLFVLTLPLGSLAYTAIATASVWNHHRGRIIWKGVTFSATDVQAASRPDPGRADASRPVAAAASLPLVVPDPERPA
ncbi:MAG: glycosyl transferase family 2 [Planctomycetota bacterium]|nr:glycosyl transferase family 2 [Planctomycetota bacterium]